MIPLVSDAQFGVASETTHGVYTAPTTFYEFLSESLTASFERTASAGLTRGRRVGLSRRRIQAQKIVGGDVALEVPTNGLGLLLRHALGDVDSSQPDDVGAPDVWSHVFTPGDLPEGLTAQVGKADESGTMHAFTYLGCVIAAWNLAVSVGDTAKFTTTLNAQDEVLTEGLEVASYPADLDLLHAIHASLLIDGVEVPVTAAEVTGDTGLRQDRFPLGNRLRRKPVESTRRNYSGTFTAFWQDLDLYNAFLAGADAELTLLLEHDGIDLGGGLHPTLKVRANVQFDSANTNVSGQEEVMQEVPYTVAENAAGLSIEVTYQTTDATV